MNSFERVMAAVNHQPVDRIPVYPLLCGATRRLVNASYPDWSQNSEICANAFLKSAEQFDIDCIVALVDLSVECDAWGQKIVYPENDAAHADHNESVINCIEDYAKIKKVDYRQSRRMMMYIDVIRRIAAEKKGKLPIIAFMFGPLGTLSMLRNQQEMYMDLYDDIDAVKQATNEVAETLKDYAGAICEAGADAIMFDTLFASGSIMSKQMWLDVEADAMRGIAEHTRKCGALPMIHNCGQKIYFDAIIDAVKPAAISFLYPPDDCADFAECKRKYGDKTMLVGCVTPTNAVIGSDEQWDKECREQIDAMGRGSGFMLSTGCEYPSDAPFERAYRMIEIAKTYGRTDA